MAATYSEVWEKTDPFGVIKPDPLQQWRARPLFSAVLT